MTPFRTLRLRVLMSLRPRNDQRGLCISGEDDEAYSCLHERLLRDLEEVTVACFAMFTLAITRGAQVSHVFSCSSSTSPFIYPPSSRSPLFLCVCQRAALRAPIRIPASARGRVRILVFKTTCTPEHTKTNARRSASTVYSVNSKDVIRK